ncbi:NAD(+) synthase [Paludibacter sp.]
MKYGFVKVAAAIPSLKVADCRFNVESIIELIEKAEKEEVEIICFPELSLTGYTCGDLFFQLQLQKNAENALNDLVASSFSKKIAIIAGLPLRVQNQLFNVGVVIQSGKILGAVPKSYLPNSNEFSEKRWFTSGLDAKITEVQINGLTVPFGVNQLFTYEDCTFAIEVCKDLWVANPPSTQHTLNGADIIFNLSASDELIGKRKYLLQLIEQQSGRTYSGYVYSSAGYGESSTDLVFAGNAIIAENGRILNLSERFLLDPQIIISEIDVEKLKSEKLKNLSINSGCSNTIYTTIKCESSNKPFENLARQINKHPFVPQGSSKEETLHEIISLQSLALAKRWQHTKAENLVIGISGGLDSTLALLVCVNASDKLQYDRKKIIGITMPGFGTTNRTYQNSVKLMESLGVTSKEISIKDACLQHFKDIGHDANIHDVTYENVQARERTQILMDYANKHNGIVVGTGDLSEAALGWSTYNGDHMSMYNVNCGVPKTLVRHLVDWVSRNTDSDAGAILQDILATPVSPELLPTDSDGNITQKTENIVGPYELHDFFLYYFVRFGFTPDKIFFLAQQAFKSDYADKTIAKWLRVFLKRFFSQQFKRSCVPDGPKIGTVSLSPRGDWKMPSDTVGFEW